VILLISVKQQKEGIIQSAVDTIKRYVPAYYEIGLFGSVARGTYSASSDVDIYTITNLGIDKHTKAELTADLEELGVDIVFLTKNDLTENQEFLLIKNILKDRRILDRVER
jgi:predicted nucleotidyltransferase